MHSVDMRHIVDTIGETPTSGENRAAFSDRFKRAIEDAIIVGVKAAVVIVILAVALFAAVGDYVQTRQRAEHGERAFQFLTQQQKPAQPEAPQK